MHEFAHAQSFDAALPLPFSRKQHLLMFAVQAFFPLKFQALGFQLQGDMVNLAYDNLYLVWWQVKAVSKASKSESSMSISCCKLQGAEAALKEGPQKLAMAALWVAAKASQKQDHPMIKAWQEPGLQSCCLMFEMYELRCIE